jgi:hypothetical protein
MKLDKSESPLNSPNELELITPKLEDDSKGILAESLDE